MSTEIRIYVTDLAAYNNGKLHGVWINVTDDLDDIQEQINKMLASSPEGFAEEYAIHDYEGFDGYSLGEYEGIEAAHEIACLFYRTIPRFWRRIVEQFWWEPGRSQNSGRRKLLWLL
jgi:antirestriction protein ArdA